MAIREQGRGRNIEDYGGQSPWPKSDRMAVSPQQAAAFLRGMARLLTLGADAIQGQRQLPGGREAADVIEGEIVHHD